MFTKKTMLRAAGASLAVVLSLAVQPARAQGSDAERLQKLEQAVSQLQKRNAELEQEVSGLKKRTSWAPVVGAEGKTKTEVTYDGKTYVEKAVVEEKAPVYVQQRGPELKLVLGGFIQFNAESGDVFAFQGNFGQTAINDRFLLRRARINMTGDYAEQFDFKIEGDFEQNDGTNGGRRDFSGTDIFINWHQFPSAQVKAGQYKAPFGLEQLTPDTSLYTIERSIATGAITPERQIGIQLWGKPFTNIWPEQKDLVTYYAGVFNGNGRISQAGNLLVNADGSLSSFTLPSAAQRTAWSVDAWLELGPFDLIGEYLQETVLPRTVPGATPAFSAFNSDGFYVTGAYYILPKKLQAVVQWQFLNPGQKGNDGIPSILGGLNYYIRGDSVKLMVNYIHTWSDFRQANPQFGDDQFDEVLMRAQVMF